MTDRTTNLLLKAEVDQGAASAGVAALRQLKAAQDDVVASFSKVDSDAAALQELRQQFIAAADAMDKIADSTKTADDRLQQYIDDLKKAADNQNLLQTDPFGGSGDGSGGASGGGAGGGVSSLRTTGRALDALGLQDIGRPIQLLGDLGIVVKEVGVAAEAAGVSVTAAGVAFGGMEVALAPLLPVIALITAAVTAAVIVYEKYAAAEEQHKKDVDNGIAVLDTYYGAIVKGTTAVIQAQLDLQKADLAAKQGELADIQKQIDANRPSTQTRPTGLIGNLADLGKSLGTDVTDPIAQKVVPAFGDLKAKGDELAKQIQDDQNKIAGLTAAMGSQQVAANDAAEATKKLQDAIDQQAEKDLAKQAEYAQLQQSGTSKGVQQRINDDQAEIESTNAYIAAHQLSQQETEKLVQKMRDLQADEEALTNTILPAVKAREDEEQAVKDADKAWKDFTNTLKQLGTVTDNINRMISDQATKVQQENEAAQRQASRAATEADYQARIDAAKRQKAEQAERDKVAQADADALTKFNDDKAQIVANGFDAELKAYSDYIDAEQRQTDQANKQRLQTLEKAQLDLNQLAAQGDVAGFVNRSNQAKLDLKNQVENADDAQKQLFANYEKQTQVARDNEQKQLDDLQTSFDREKQVRDNAADQRIQQIEDSGKQANTESARLEQELNNIREQWRQDDLKRQRDQEEAAFEERLQLEKDKQNELLAQSAQFFDDWLKNMSNTLVPGLGNIVSNLAQTVQQLNPVQSAGNLLNDAANTVSGWFSAPQLAGGIDYVPGNRFPAYLDRGERVLTAAENAAYSGGNRGGQPINVTIYNTVGDIATQSMLDDYQQTTIDGVKSAFQQAKGRGN